MLVHDREPVERHEICFSLKDYNRIDGTMDI